MDMTPQPSRRALLLGGGATAAAAWVAPAVVGLDRVGAAVGSCGTPPLQIDWTDYAGTFPTSITANDGTTVTISLSDPFGVADAGFFGQAYNGTTSQRDNPLLMAMSNANNGDYIEITFTFSSAVTPCFELIDVDQAGGWEDTVIVTGSLGGTAVDLGPADFTTGTATNVVGTNTVRGVANAAASTVDGNVTVTYPSAVNQITVRHQDLSTGTAFQFIGIHDFRWC